MQAVKKAAVSVKETAENIAASARSGMTKAKAVVQEKVEKMKAKDASEKQRAEERKVRKIEEAETLKRLAREQHAAATRGRGGAGGVRGHPTGLAVAHAGHRHAGGGRHVLGDQEKEILATATTAPAHQPT